MTNSEPVTDLCCTMKLMLDTHVLIWYAEGINLSSIQVEIIEHYRKEDSLLVSRISMWEIAMLLNKGRLSLSLPLQEWIENLINVEGLSVADLTTNVLIESCQLPNYAHKDPIDRMIIATARCFNATLMTIDQKILEYGKNGYIKVSSDLFYSLFSTSHTMSTSTTNLSDA